MAFKSKCELLNLQDVIWMHAPSAFVKTVQGCFVALLACDIQKFLMNAREEDQVGSVA